MTAVGNFDMVAHDLWISDMPCPLCHKIEEYQSHDVVAVFEHSIVFLGPWQYYEGYCIVTARQHYTELFELSIEVRHALMDEVARTAKAIYDVVKPRKINYEWLGNQVPHLHWHLFPRKVIDPNHLQAAWLDIAEAEKDAVKKEHWMHCAQGKAQLIQELQRALGV